LALFKKDFELCAKYLEKIITILNPEHLFCFGNSAHHIMGILNKNYTKLQHPGAWEKKGTTPQQKKKLWSSLYPKLNLGSTSKSPTKTSNAKNNNNA
jgi:uracil-DNA glycosylase